MIQLDLEQLFGLDVLWSALLVYIILFYDLSPDVWPKDALEPEEIYFSSA